jgi:hypothetical protein
MAQIDTKAWSGEGTFTQVLLERLQTLGEIAFIRVEDAPATRSEADYNFVSNEVFVAFATETRREPFKRFGVIPGHRAVVRAATSIAGLEELLTASADIGPPDYSDAGMLQYLRTERIVPPYQTRGYKLVELVRIYEVGTKTPDRRGAQAGD